MRPMLLTATLLAAMLAGCADSPATDVGMDDDPDAPAEEGLAMPEWQIGDYWTFNDGTDTFSMVVEGETPTSWTLGTDGENFAFFEEVFGPISYFGTQNKDNLAGSQSAGPVDFFEWPLHDGRTWSTTWDGLTVQITAFETGFEEFRMEARLGEELYADYQYSAASKWFDWIQFHGDGGNWRMDQVGRGTNFDGELVRVTAELVESGSGQGGATSTFFDAFNAGDDADLYVFYSGSCPEIANGNGALYTFAIGPLENVPGAANEGLAANDDGYTDSDQCPHAEQFRGVIGWHPNEGNWGFVVEAPVDASWSFDLYLREFERITL